MKRLLLLLLLIGCANPDWCEEESYNSTDGNITAHVEVVGIERTGEYRGYCHTVYTVKGEKVDAYYDEQGDGYHIYNGEITEI